MEQVSLEVKEAYLNNLTYTTINKKDWKALTKEYNVDNADETQFLFIRFMIALSIIIVVTTVVISMFFNDLNIMFFALSSVIPFILIIVEEEFDTVHRRVQKEDRFLYNYRKANDTFYVLIEGNDKYRYYSRWYLELINPKVAAQNLSRTLPEDEVRYINFNDNGCVITYDHPTKGHQRTKYELYPFTRRHHDRFNWRNTLSTNRVLSIKEYKNLIKSKEEFKKFMEMEEDIKEFQEYNGL